MFKLSLITLVLWVLTLLVMPGKAATDDPTRPPSFSTGSKVTQKPLAPRSVLSSTLVSPERRSAVINGRVVTLGEDVSGARVMEIDSMKVVLNNNGQQIVLMLLEKNIKQPSKSVDKQVGQ